MDLAPAPFTGTSQCASRSFTPEGRDRRVPVHIASGYKLTPQPRFAAMPHLLHFRGALLSALSLVVSKLV